MKILKRTLLVLLVLLLLAQIPFIYRRYQTGKLAERIAQLESQRTTYSDPNFKEYKGVIHAHTNIGGHSSGTFDELIAAANANDLDFVLMTEHISDTVDTAALTLNGVYGKTLFVGGNEVETTDSDRFLLIPGGGEAVKARMQGTNAFLETARRENKLALITYPERFKSWDSAFDGIEIFSLHTAAKQMNPLLALGDLVWTYPSYPELMLAKGWTRPDANLAKFDEIASQQALMNCLVGAPGCRVVLFAGADAHSNIGIHLFGDDAGNKLINIKLDSYKTIFRMARIHVWLPAGTNLYQESLISAIKNGDFFVAFDAIGNSDGFRFEEAASTETLAVGGFPNHSSIRVRVPLPSRVVLFKNGRVERDVTGELTSEFEMIPPGTYRVEVYRDDLGPPFDKMPWIISNPIYVR